MILFHHDSAASLRSAAIEIVRTGTRVVMFLEPLAEVETPIGHVGYGPSHMSSRVTAMWRSGRVQKCTRTRGGGR